MSIVHLYAKEYGWNREYVLDNVFVDEHFIQNEIIDSNKRHDWLMKSYIALLPNMEDKPRQEFLKSLESKKENPVRKKVKAVSFDETKEAIKKAQQQLKSM